MEYIFSIAKALMDYDKIESQPLVISAARDLLLLAESQMISQIMLKTASKDTKQQTPHVDELLNSLKDSTRNIQDVIKNIEYLQNNIGQFMPFSIDKQYETATKTAERLAVLRDSSVIIKDYKLASEIDNILEAVGLLN